ncbi:hypothetical protein Sgly_1339 [Syntrophobotulus glycolicus DSM 8271]|uniref:Uncharacterized protein n=1 Tax=Syntrophobotulus glycolicus (strain DSM 8271 / FlGlyR) TaxID=645991 RepID=F0SVT8_SYNGF|nr:hypothetical protein [Syntrophobotulus glycolicus]ADY55644.1 hypothetical protein Sgly_1339 [Syntrophobotulus glycolicus DSM 8271]
MKKYYFLIVLLLIAALPVQARAAQLPADGQYMIEVTLVGGTGRAAVESPAKLTVAGGAAIAAVVWSSPYYEEMQVDGITYHPVHAGGNSTFEIPVEFDEDMKVKAQTVAMSVPHEIDYTLRFDAATLKPSGRNRFPLTLPGAGVVAAILIIVLAGVFGNKKRRRENRNQ